MVRVVGTDPGSSSLDLLLLVDGAMADQARLTPELLGSDPGAIVAALRAWEPLDLVAGPSGYGLPLVRAADLTEADLEAMSLVRSDERGQGVGLVGFRAWVRSLVASELPVVFLPGGTHLPTIPPHRKVNTIDMGTADKVAVAALALAMHSERTGARLHESSFAVVELGSVFSAILVVQGGQIVDVSAGTRGPIGLGSAGAWDGEAAYWLSPLSKADLYRGGFGDLGREGPAAFRESLRKHLAGLQAVTPFSRVYLSGSGADRPEIAQLARDAMCDLVSIEPLPVLPGAWVKHSAQGAALLADGLAGGRSSPVVESMALRRASGHVCDSLRIPRT